MTHVSSGLVVLLDGAVSAEQVMSFTRQKTPCAALSSLMSAICANPLWLDMPAAQLVGRAESDILLGVFSDFTNDQRDRLQDLAIHLREVLSRHRYVDYAAAERVTASLAVKLRDALSPECLAKARFAAIPRGGYIVLGMLSYYLDLRPDQLTSLDSAPAADDEWLVVVDDCSLSGVRFQQTLSKLDHERVVFCPLYAVPALCRNIEAREPRVVKCINGEDLDDIAPERYAESYSAWRERRESQLCGHGYWIGVTEYVAFAWCEPQTRYWDEAMQAFAPGWNILPPELSIKRRMTAEGLCQSMARTSLVSHSGAGPLLPSERLLWFDKGDALLLAGLTPEHGDAVPVFNLEGVAAEMWRCLVDTGSLEAAHRVLLERYRVDADRLLTDLQAFLAQLIDHELLIMSDAP